MNRVQVPDDPLAGLRPSRIYERIAAHLIDLAVLLFIQIPLIFFLTARILSGDLISLILLLSLSLLIFLLYFTLSEGMLSTTLGKRALGLRVLSLSSMNRVSMTESFIRNLFRLSDALVLYLPVLILSGGRRIGDALANTVVVSKDFLRVELPSGKSALHEELRRSIIIAAYQELKPLADKPSFSEFQYESSIRDYISGVLSIEDSDLLNFLTYFLSNPSFQLRVLGIEGVARIYERASELCEGYPSKLLRNRAGVIRAYASEIADRKIYISRILKLAPKEFRGLSGYFVVSALLFILSSILAYHLRPQWVEDLIKEIFGREAIPREADPLTLTAVILLNNIRVVLATLGTSPLIIMPFLTLVSNGLIVGLAFSLYGDPFRVMLLIIPHGIPELTSIFISSAIGLRICRQLLRGEDRWLRAREAVVNSLNLIFLSLILLLYAAFVEGFLTRPLAELPIVSILFSLIEAILIYSYLFLRPRSSLKDEVRSL